MHCNKQQICIVKQSAVQMKCDKSRVWQEEPLQCASLSCCSPGCALCGQCRVCSNRLCDTCQCTVCEHCTAQASPAVQEGDIGLPTSGWQQQGTLDNHPPCGICIPDIAGADPWHWTLDIGFQCRLGKRCCKLARLRWTSHPGIPFSQCTEGIMATLEPADNSMPSNRQTKKSDL